MAELLQLTQSTEPRQLPSGLEPVKNRKNRAFWEINLGNVGAVGFGPEEVGRRRFGVVCHGICFVWGKISFGMTAASSSAAAAAAALPSCQKLVLLAVALLDVASVLSVGQDSRRDKLVTTQLNAKWPSTPFTLEAAEFLAEEAGNEAFWHFVDFLVEHEEEGDRQTDREKYQGTVSFASRFLSSTQLNLMKLSLSLRTQSPRIEMFQQVAEDRGVGEKAAQCPANSPILEAGGKLHCDLSDVDLGSGPEQNGGPEIIKVDHHFPHVAEDAETVILYAEPGRTGFRKVHEALKTMASQGRIDYVLRPFLRNRRSQKTRLSGIHKGLCMFCVYNT